MNERISRSAKRPKQQTGAYIIAAQKTVFIKTFGCQMNVYDSERMAEVLAPSGFAAAERMEDADLVILNTCHIREKAAEKVYSELGRVRAGARARQRAGKRQIIAVAGCVAQAEGPEILSRAPAVDLVIGPQSYHRLPDLVAKVQSGQSGLIETDFPAEDKFRALPARTSRIRPTAFLSVQEGCDKFCTFCVVPYTRGAEYSRPAQDILEEARRLTEQGVREITLLGQNVNAYHGTAMPGSGDAHRSLAQLLHELAAIPELDRLRYTTSHPCDMSDDLIAAHRDIAKLMPYLHLPIQSGSDRILSTMNRRHDADDYRAVIARLRAARPDIALSTDIIVGFPGESDADFEATLNLVREIGFASAYSFKYSPRPGTPAAERAGQIPEPVKAERLSRLQAELNVQQAAFNAACIGTRQSVLLEAHGRKGGQLVGRSPYLQAVHVEANANMLGALIEVEITTAGPNSLSGILTPTTATVSSSGYATPSIS